MQVVEIAVFEANVPEGFALKQPKLHAQLGDLFEGYVGSLGLRSQAEAGVFADVVLWESVECAQAAAAAIGDHAELAWFNDELGTIRFFDHLQPAGNWEAIVNAAQAPVVEIVLVKPADPAAFATAHASLHDDHLDSADAVISHLRLLTNANGIAGDLNGWTGHDAMEVMGPALMERPELAPAFDEANEMLLFMSFTVNVMP
jgi:hypothetical protein